MDIQERIRQIKERELEQLKNSRVNQPEDVNETTEIVDIYQRDVNNLREESKKSRPKGASTVITVATHDVIDDGLAHAYKRAKDDSELL